MLVEVDRLTQVVDSNPVNMQQLSNVGPHIWQMRGSRADVTYVDVGRNCAEILSINPRTESLDRMLKEILEVGELEGGAYKIY